MQTKNANYWQLIIGYLPLAISSYGSNLIDIELMTEMDDYLDVSSQGIRETDIRNEHTDAKMDRYAIQKRHLQPLTKFASIIIRNQVSFGYANYDHHIWA